MSCMLKMGYFLIMGLANKEQNFNYDSFFKKSGDPNVKKIWDIYNLLINLLNEKNEQ